MTPEEELRELWAHIPTAGCIGLCKDSCGPIAMTELEAEILSPRLPLGVPTADQMVGEFVEDPTNWHSPLLVNGRCSAYADRPTICRMWGVEESMPCPYGCRPRVVLTTEEGHRLMRRSIAIGGPIR